MTIEPLKWPLGVRLGFVYMAGAVVAALYGFGYAFDAYFFPLVLFYGIRWWWKKNHRRPTAT